MQDMTRAELLQNTPKRYLAAGYVTDAGTPRPELCANFATAASVQLMAAKVAPQELALTAEAIRQLLPACKGTPANRLASAMTQMRDQIPRTIGQPGNAGLAAWLDDCASAIVTNADLDAFLEHVRAVQRQYSLIVAMTLCAG